MVSYGGNLNITDSHWIIIHFYTLQGLLICLLVMASCHINRTTQCKCTLYCIALLAKHVTADMYWCVYTCSHSIIHNDRKSKWRIFWSVIKLSKKLNAINHLVMGYKCSIIWFYLFTWQLELILIMVNG